MSEIERWFQSWETLRVQFEDASYESPNSYLCLKEHHGDFLAQTTSFHKNIDLTGQWQDENIGSRTNVMLRDAIGIGAMESFGTSIPNRSYTWWILHRSLALTAIEKQDRDELLTEVTAARELESTFRNLSDSAGYLWHSTPKKSPLIPKKPLLAAADHKQWILMLFDFAANSYSEEDKFLLLSSGIPPFYSPANRYGDAAQLFGQGFQTLNTNPFRASMMLIDWILKFEESDQDLDAHHAHRKRLFPNGEIKDVDLRDAIIKLDTLRSKENTDIGILRDFTGETKGDCPKALSLQKRIRKARQDGRTTLPPR